ncbi:MAG TPA: tRNA (adenosine(37)-N6)-dimethylallyltransferase MiaA [Anaerolineales bacterium]|nr:tRNA (adenosine(37)-N6)-dimethylallyltransferase MiaA [Anaerolineales bacterium]
MTLLNPNRLRASKILPLVVIVGPTAVGKTESAIKLAEWFDGEIVSADSRLLYCGMNIGTAKPSLQERSRVPHHLIDVSPPDQGWSLAVYKNAATQAIKDIHARNHLPFLVGGTGQYIRAIIEQWDIPIAQPNMQLRSLLEKWGHRESGERLHQRLAILDPEAAKTIDPRNLRRTVRAIEVILTTGKRFSSLRGRGPSHYNLLTIGLTRPRAELYNRIDARIQKMIDSGLIEEVKSLLDKGYASDLPTLSAIGYGEIISYLNGKSTLAEAVAQMKRRTRIFVRRQANWFKLDDPEISWYLMHPAIEDEIATRIRDWMNDT